MRRHDDSPKVRYLNDWEFRLQVNTLLAWHNRGIDVPAIAALATALWTEEVTFDQSERETIDRLMGETVGVDSVVVEKVHR